MSYITTNVRNLSITSLAYAGSSRRSGRLRENPNCVILSESEGSAFPLASPKQILRRSAPQNDSLRRLSRGAEGLSCQRPAAEGEVDASLRSA
jgi:hypothetical protein